MGDLSVGDAVFVQVATPISRAGRAIPPAAQRDRPTGRPDQRRPGQDRSPGDLLSALILPRQEMAALYRAADIMVVTPFRDGMNLVAKEYVACRLTDDGALVLSEFAGAAEELRQAWT
jgi:trehalose 6-phosphate synthase